MIIIHVRSNNGGLLHTRSWSHGERKLAIGINNVTEIHASGDDRELIIHRSTNIPYSYLDDGVEFQVWTGDFAKYIYANFIWDQSTLK